MRTLKFNPRQVIVRPWLGYPNLGHTTLPVNIPYKYMWPDHTLNIELCLLTISDMFL